MENKFLLIYHLPDGENSHIAYCKKESEVKQLIQDWIKNGDDIKDMEVVRVRKISKVRSKIVKTNIIF